MSIYKRETCGSLPDGRKVDHFTLVNDKGMELKVINLGAIITHWFLPDRNGILDDVIGGYESPDAYLKDSLISEGTYPADKALWAGEEFPVEEGVALKLSLSEPSEVEGRLSAEIIFVLTNDDALEVMYQARSDKKRTLSLKQNLPVNLTGMTEDVSEHVLLLNADSFSPGQHGHDKSEVLAGVQDTRFDFREAKPIGKLNEDDPEKLNDIKGYDHSWKINRDPEEPVSHSASLYEVRSGRLLEIFTSEPYVHFNSGNELRNEITGKNNITYGPMSALCLTPHSLEQSPDSPGVSSVKLEAGKEHRSVTIFRCSVR